ncbi:MAG: TrkH family potassium uptake protein, partial [Erysipelotrichales bacterium]|nr:TrkH family potassium uptake protein [Erysipelotrichales bacterium]
TAFATLMFGTWSFLHGQKKLNIFKREISYEFVKSSLCIFTAAAFLVFAGTFVLLISDDFTFMETLFEVVSALATVGLTLGITSSLSTVGKIVIIILMYVGRVGVLTLLTYFMRKNDIYAENEIAYPQANILIG